jgi:hypothetical protein
MALLYDHTFKDKSRKATDSTAATLVPLGLTVSEPGATSISLPAVGVGATGQAEFSVELAREAVTSESVAVKSLGLSVQAPGTTSISLPSVGVGTGSQVESVVELVREATSSESVTTKALGLSVQAPGTTSISLPTVGVGTSGQAAFGVELVRTATSSESVSVVGLGLSVTPPQGTVIGLPAVDVTTTDDVAFAVDNNPLEIVTFSAGAVFGSGVEGQIDVQGGSAPYSWSVTTGSPAQQVDSGTIFTQDGSASWSDPNGTSGQSYDLSVTDDNGTTVTASATA